MHKDFDGWNSRKKMLEHTESRAPVFAQVGDVWMCSLGINVGYEQNGIGNDFERPAVVVKKFNNKMYWVVPLSSKQKPFDFYYNFTDPLGNEVSAIAAQLRLMSIKRFRRSMYKMPEAQLVPLVKKLKGFLE